MSVVVVKKFPDRIEIGADHQVTYGRRKEIHDGKKPDGSFDVCKIERLEEDFIIAGVGWHRNFYFMRRFLETNKPASESNDSFTSLYQDFLDYARMQVSNGDVSTAAGNSFIIVYGSSVFLLGDYRSEEVTNYYSIGSGADFALGVLHALESVNMGDIGIEPALKAACRFDLYCHEPLTMFSVPILGEDE